MSSRVLSTPQLGLVWLGAAISLAEILTGTFFAPLGLEQGLAAIVIGHLIGGVMFALVGYISAKTGESAMRAVARSFGRVGAGAFSVANVIQLGGWTAIMILSGAQAATLLVPAPGMTGWCVAIGALIVVWIVIGVKNMGRVQSAAALLLLVLTFAVSVAVFGSASPAGIAADELSFGGAVELAVAMPLSWLPVVGDYTRESKRPLAGTLAASGSYLFGSCWMFAIGLGCALFAGNGDIASVLADAGMGAVGIVVVVFSTVTTTFLDAQSAGISAQSIHPRLDARVIGVAAAVVGALLAAFAPIGDFEDFLYLIGSVFAPMAAVLCADFFILKRDRSTSALDVRNAVLWAVGFVLYRFSLSWDLPCGNTLPVMAAIVAAALAVDFIASHLKVRRDKTASA